MKGWTLGKLVGGTALAGMLGTAIAADVLLIEKVRERMMRTLPENGLTTTEVERDFGQPRQRYGPVGQPPISRWDYEDFSVFFEYDLVIESVLHHDAVADTVQEDPAEP
ncbi:MAG: hypothetical protein HND55_07200 [Pseudomonadota bacterium]|nr:MAG: hypothetical protein HND55_07200 [Pseudomonadota bacterium]